MSVTNSAADLAPTPPTSSPAQPSSRFLFWVGALLAIAVIPIFAAQVFWAQALFTPWYLPIGGTAAALLVIYAVGQRSSWWRLGIALGCFALACLEWSFLLTLTVLPSYVGPIAEGSRIPAFRATLADGSEITGSYFEQQRPTALIFFQGRWCPFCMTQLRELESHHDAFDRLGANVVVVSIEDQQTAAQTQRDFPHLTVVSDQQRELSTAIDLINKGFAPDGSDADAPTILLLDGSGTVQWLHRPARFIARPSAAELAARIEQQQKIPR